MSYNVLQPNNDPNRSYDQVTTFLITYASGVLTFVTTNQAKEVLTGDVVETTESKLSIMGKDLYIRLYNYRNNHDYKSAYADVPVVEFINKYNKHPICTVNAVNLNPSSSFYNVNMSTYYTSLSTNIFA
jgi:hypothetical protein